MEAGDNGALPSSEVEVMAKPVRRRFTAENKLGVLRQADRCKGRGEVGALLRREGLYSSHLTQWRKQRERGERQGLSRRRGPLLPVSIFPVSVLPAFLIVTGRVIFFDLSVLGMRFKVQIKRYPPALFNDVMPGQLSSISPLSPFEPVIPSNAGIKVNFDVRVVVIRFMLAAVSMRGSPGWRPPTPV